MVDFDRSKAPNVVVIGGGTGSFTVLSGLKEYTDNITALVNMSDDGGSTGVLRDELGVLPPGDARQCLIALSDSKKLRELFNFRFSRGGLRGHSFGNIFLSAVEQMTDSFEEAIGMASEVLNIKGRVIPITTDDIKLALDKKDGTKLVSQFKISRMKFLGRGKNKPDLHLEPVARLTEAGRDAIMDADLVLIAPGNLYGSLAPTLMVEGVREALQNTNAKIIYIVNLVTKKKKGQAMRVSDFTSEVERFVGCRVLDFVFYNTASPAKELEAKYFRKGEVLVDFDLAKLSKQHYVAVGLPLISNSINRYSKFDKIAKSRSLIRHDMTVLLEQILSL